MPEEVFIDLTQESDDEAAPPPAPAEGGDGASGVAASGVAVSGVAASGVAASGVARMAATMSDFSAQSKTQATFVALVSPLSNAYVVARVQLTMPAVPFNCQQAIGLGPLRGVHSTPMGRIVP